MSIFTEIVEDHGTQRTLVDLLVKTHGDSEGRKELFAGLKSELKRHAEAEERHFYVPLFDHDSTQEQARHSVAEHHEIDELICKLEETDMESSGWLATAKKLQEQVHHHLDEEEKEVFGMAKKVMSEPDQNRLGEEYRQRMKESEG